MWSSVGTGGYGVWSSVGTKTSEKRVSHQSMWLLVDAQEIGNTYTHTHTHTHTHTRDEIQASVSFEYGDGHKVGGVFTEYQVPRPEEEVC